MIPLPFDLKIFRFFSFYFPVFLDKLHLSASSFPLSHIVPFLYPIYFFRFVLFSVINSSSCCFLLLLMVLVWKAKHTVIISHVSSSSSSSPLYKTLARNLSRTFVVDPWMRCQIVRLSEEKVCYVFYKQSEMYPKNPRLDIATKFVTSECRRDLRLIFFFTRLSK